MNTEGTLDYYRELAETNHDIAVLVDMIDKLQAELVLAIIQSIKV